MTFPVKCALDDSKIGFAGMPLVFTLAFRNLFHDRLRFIATVIGIVFSIVLVTVQMGLYLGFGQMVTTMIDHASADLWIMPKGTKCFEDPSLLDTRQRSRALVDPRHGRGDPGGDRLCRLAHRRTARRRRSSWSARICAPAGSSRGIWSKAASSRSPLRTRSPSTAPTSTGSAFRGWAREAEIRQQSVRVAAVTDGIRSFTTTPYVFMDVDRARAHTGMPSSKATYFLVRVGQGADVEQVRRNLQASLDRCRGADAGRIPRAQPLVLAVRHRRGRGAVRRRAARRDRRHRDRRADALFQHQGSLERVRHAARDRLVAQIHLQGHHLPGAAERRDRFRPGLSRSASWWCA